jgi:uncharacterized protein YlaN (UPF0358 family)
MAFFSANLQQVAVQVKSDDQNKINALETVVLDCQTFPGCPNRMD